MKNDLKELELYFGGTGTGTGTGADIIYSKDNNSDITLDSATGKISDFFAGGFVFLGHRNIHNQHSFRFDLL